MSIISAEDAGFWKRVFSALQRGIALGLFVGLHYGLNFGLAITVPHNMIGALLYVQDVIFVFFCLIYVYLAWDMFTAFFPRLKVLGTVDAKPLEPGDET